MNVGNISFASLNFVVFAIMQPQKGGTSMQISSPLSPAVKKNQQACRAGI